MTPMKKFVLGMSKEDVLNSSHKSLEFLHEFCLHNFFDVRAISLVVPVGYAAVYGKILNETGIFKRKIQMQAATVTNLFVRDQGKVDTKIWGTDLSNNSHQKHIDYMLHNHVSYCSKMYARKHVLISNKFEQHLPNADQPNFVDDTTKLFEEFADRLQKHKELDL